jgi:hypothetical protein
MRALDWYEKIEIQLKISTHAILRKAKQLRRMNPNSRDNFAKVLRESSHAMKRIHHRRVILDEEGKFSSVR